MRRTAVQRRWQARDGFVLFGDRVPASSLRAATDPSVELKSLPTAAPETYSIMGNQRSGRCLLQVNRYYLKARSAIAEHVSGRVLGPDDVVAIGVVTYLSDAQEVLSLNLAVLEPFDEDDAWVTHDVRVWCGAVPNIEGLFLGAVVGVIGSVASRDVAHNVSAIAATEIVLPPRPPLRWEASAPVEEGAGRGRAVPLRLHFVAGPYPRLPERSEFLRSVVLQAMERTADVLILVGPFVEEPREGEPTPDVSFVTQLWQQCDAIVKLLEGQRLHVVMIPTLDDVGVTPILPQLPLDYPLDDAAPVHLTLGTNPHFFSLRGPGAADGGPTVEVGVVGGDPRAPIASTYWNPTRLPRPALEQRYVEAMLRANLAAPLVDGKSAYVDLAHLSSTSLSRDGHLPHILAVVGGPAPRATLSDGDHGAVVLDLGKGVSALNAPECTVVEVTILDASTFARDGASTATVVVQSRGLSLQS